MINWQVITISVMYFVGVIWLKSIQENKVYALERITNDHLENFARHNKILNKLRSHNRGTIYTKYLRLALS